MRRRRQFLMLLLASGSLLVVVGTTLSVVLKHEPAFYQRGTLPAGPERQRLAQEFMNRSSDFYNLVTNNQEWGLTFSQDQLNAYLQDEQCASAGLFTYPEHVSNPRVEFCEDRIRIGVRYDTGWSSAILSVDLKVWLVAKEPNLIALELCGLSVGGMPLGSHALMEYFSEAAREWNADISWYRTGRHPVALIRLQANQNRPTLQLRRFEVQNGKVVLHGKPANEMAAPAPAVGG